MNDARSPESGCPDPETLAAYIDDRLSAPDRAAVEAHLADCDACREVVVDTVATMPEVDATTPPLETPMSASITLPSSTARKARARWLTAAGAGVLLAGAGWAVLHTLCGP